MEFHHIPVLLAQCMEALAIQPDGIYLDGTVGGAGHSKEIAARLQTGRLICLDQDPDAVATARERLAGLPATVIQENFRNTAAVLDGAGVTGLNGALLDLGVSSHQLDETARGFSYQGDAPLDMRMSQAGPTAADLVNGLSREELSRILREYGRQDLCCPAAGSNPYHFAAGTADGRCHAACTAPEGEEPGAAYISGASHCGERRTGRIERGYGCHF